MYESIATCDERAVVGTGANLDNNLTNIVGAHEAYGFILPVSGDVIATKRRTPVTYVHTGFECGAL